MLKLVQNFRIVTKLAIASVLSISLRFDDIQPDRRQFRGQKSQRKCDRAAILARDAVDAKASIRGMKVGVRDQLLI
jgi:hypothetical protein